MLRLPYGYTVDQNDRIIIRQAEAEIVKMIFQSYLTGDSLGKIADQLSEEKIPSPTDKDGWSRAAIDKLLSNGKYVPHIISIEEFLEVQMEKANRSSINYDTGKRKATRYNSQNVLSGLLVCAECGANYRRITPASGEVVWRCANRVEHGKKICKYSPTLSEAEVKHFLCKALNVDKYDPKAVRESIEAILVNSGAQLTVQYRETISLCQS
jgi:hypothetical protein